MVTVGIGAACSGAGKTYFACALIKKLASMGMAPSAIKCTRHPLYSSVTDDPGTIGQPGKDTALMKDAGASEVLWVHIAPEAHEETLQAALGRLAAHDIVIIEGNRAIEVLKPDIVVFITWSGNCPSGKKDNAKRILALADVVLTDSDAPHAGGGRSGARTFRRDETGEAVSHLAALVGKAC